VHHKRPRRRRLELWRAKPDQTMSRRFPERRRSFKDGGWGE
jgi:hypothetical protein